MLEMMKKNFRWEHFKVDSYNSFPIIITQEVDMEAFEMAN